MFIQIVIGSAMLLLSIVVTGVSFWLLEWGLVRIRAWVTRPPHRPKLMLVLCAAALWVLVQMTVAVWLWAFLFLLLEIFATLEEAVYFALVAFTTLGFGDVLLPQGWRLLGGLAAVNGLLNMGLMTAAMIEVLRHLRLQQLAAAQAEP